MYGPVCPIYGFGAVFTLILFGPVAGRVGYPHEVWRNWQIFFICMLGSAVMELLTSYVLERVFHGAWWDYSDMPLNFQGRICLPASLGFGIAGIAIVRYILPVVMQVEAHVYPIVNEGVSLLLMAIFSADLVLTVSGLTDLLAKVEGAECNMNERMQSAYETIEQGLTENQLTERAREYVSRLDFRQLNALRNIKFRGPKSSRLGERMKTMVLNAKEFDKIKEIKNLRKRKN